MELKKYKLGDVADIVNGATPSTHNSENYDGSIIWITPKDLSGQKQKIIRRGQRNISEIGFNNCSAQMIPPYNILMSSRAPIGLLAINENECCTNQGFKNLVLDKSICDTDYMYYYLQFHMKEIEALGSGTTFKEISKSALQGLEIRLPDLEKQRDIAKCLSDLDRKIELNKQINDNLEAMAKQLYDYWFVQFDFPNEEGKPYKSSGGAMVWNEDLHISIPCTWNACLLSDYIGSNNTGDWGFDEPTEKRSIKVGCIRGADIVKLNNLPIRYIKDNNTSKLLSAWDIVIEVSGGSPTQATGRSAFVTPGVLKRNGGNLTCSNFCHAFTMKDYKASAYFYFMWRMFYDNNNMFNFEGKTSGIKNFMTDTFLANKWLDVPTVLLDLFFERVKVIFEQIDNNIEEINALTKQRDELLPLLMNGQATINYHLFDD